MSNNADPTIIERLRKRVFDANALNDDYVYQCYSYTDDSAGGSTPGYDAELDGRAADRIEQLEAGVLELTNYQLLGDRFRTARALLGDEAVDEWIAKRNQEVARKLNDEEA